MSELYENWCVTRETRDGRKKLWRLTEIDGGRDGILPDLSECVLSHYASKEEVASWVEALGNVTAAACIREQFPVGPTGKSGDLGEILASELIEERLGYIVPVKKLRDKDHREMAMRGEDVIGVAYDRHNNLLLLKGEAKSAQVLGTNTLTSAREGLEKNDGRPTSHSLIFIGRRLLNSNNDQEAAMGADLMYEAANGAIPKTRVGHYMFTMSGNPASPKEILIQSDVPLPHQFVIGDFLRGHKGFQQVNGRDGNNGCGHFLFE